MSSSKGNPTKFVQKDVYTVNVETNDIPSVPSTTKTSSTTRRVVLVIAAVCIIVLAIASVVIPLALALIRNKSTKTISTTLTTKTATTTTTKTTTITTATTSIQQIIWTDTFTNGVGASSAQMNAWITFRASLTSRNYTKVTIRGTFDTTGQVCTDPIVATSLANSLNTNTDYISSSTCNGNVWHNCATHGYGGEVWLNPPSSCSGSNCPTGYIIRPNIGGGNWGGVNSATCGGPTQQMTLIFEY